MFILRLVKYKIKIEDIGNDDVKAEIENIMAEDVDKQTKETNIREYLETKPFFRRLNYEPFIDFSTENKPTPKTRVFISDVPVKYPLIEIKNKGEAFTVLMPNTKLVCDMIRKRMQNSGKITWHNTMGLWTLSVMKFFNTSKKEEDNNE